MPDKVEIKVSDRNIEISGPKGKLEWVLPEGISCELKDNMIFVKRKDDSMFDCRIRASRLNKQDASKGMIFVITDIS